jgi:small-conductance mechanosensitive channel
MLEAELSLIDSVVQPLVGTEYAGFVTAGIVIVAFLLVAKLVSWIFRAVISRATSKTSTDLDDMLMDAISLPLIICIGIIGLFVALQRIPLSADQGNYVNLGFSVFYIFFGALIAIRVINVIVYWYAENAAKKTKTKFDDHFLPPLRRMVSLIVLLVALTMLLGVFGVDLTAAVAALGVGGIAIALAFQDTLKEFFAGGHVILDKPIRIGDLIELESADRGTVVDIGWRSTVISTWDGNYITLPNTRIANSKLINYTQPARDIAFVIQMGVSYHEDLDKVEKVTLEEAKKVIKKLGTGNPHKEPLVRFKNFGDSNIDFAVVFFVKNFGDQHPMKHEFIKAIKKRYDKEGIEISWPVRKVYEHKGKGK